MLVKGETRSGNRFLAFIGTKIVLESTVINETSKECRKKQGKGLGSTLRNPKMWTLVRKEKVRKAQKEQLV